MTSFDAHFGRVVEIACPYEGCDGNLAWLIGRSRQRNCRKCGRPVRFEHVREALADALEADDDGSTQ